VVEVQFDIKEPFAGYVLSFDGKEPEAINFNESAVRRIEREVDERLRQWIGHSDRRKEKAMAEPNMNRVLRHYENGCPMAIVSPDSQEITDPVEVKKRRLRFERELDKNLRPIGFGYHQLRHNDTFSYIIYGKPNKKSEQLLKIVATETGKKYGQKLVSFCDLNGQIYNICTAKTETTDTAAPYMALEKGKAIFYGDDTIPAYARKDIRSAIVDYHCLRGDFIDAEDICHGELAVTCGFAPIERFISTSMILRRRNACIRYCSECWDEETQTYHFDIRYNTYF
jgi:hypothetical protein